MPEDKILSKSLAELLQDDSLESKVELISKTHSSSLIPITLIKTNPYQPRTYFKKEAITELANSIKQYGVLSPIIVRRKDSLYEIVAGERRYRASIEAGLESIPAIVETFTDQEMSEIALIENIQRENLTPLEIAKSLSAYQKQFNLTQDQLSKRMGKSRSYIANILRLLNLPKSIQKELEDGTVSVGHVRTLIGLNEEESKELLTEIKNNKLNVRETESLIQKRKTTKEFLTKENHIKSLKSSLNTDISITSNELRIKYENKEDLERLIRKLTGK